MQIWNVLHSARWKYRTQKISKNRHLGTIAQLCRAVSSQLRHVSTIGKSLLNSLLNLLHMSSQYGELRPTNGWDLLPSLGHPCTFQRVTSRLGSVTARHSSSGRQPNFAALNRGRHLYSAGRPSRWALAHISSWTYLWGATRQTCQDSLLSGGGRSVWAKISRRRGRPWGIFFGFYKTRHILLSDDVNCTVLRAVVLTQYRLVTIGWTDRQTDGRNCRS